MKTYKIVFLFSFSGLLFFLSSCEQQYRDGERIYSIHCENCHMKDGKGLEELYPPLAGSDYLSNRGADIACLIRYGANEPMLVNGVEYHNLMPANKQLKLVEIANLLNYVNQAWENNNKFINIKEIQEALDNCPEIKTR